MKRELLTTLLLFTLLFNCIAQSKRRKPTSNPDIVTNASVIELENAGLDKELIIAKINNSETSFDLSASGLILLKNQKVDNDVIKVMLNKGNGPKGESTVVPAAAVAKKMPRLDLVNQVYQYNVLSNAVSPLEKTIATMKTKTKMLGYGGASVFYIVEGDKSTARISGSDSVAFLIDAGGNVPPDMSLYKLTITKGNRQATTQNISGTFKAMSGNVMSGGAIVPFNIVRASDNTYKIIPSKKLEKGEYFFAIKSVALTTSVDVYAFGID